MGTTAGIRNGLGEPGASCKNLRGAVPVGSKYSCGAAVVLSHTDSLLTTNRTAVRVLSPTSGPTEQNINLRESVLAHGVELDKGVARD